MTDSTWQVFNIDELAETVAGIEPRFHEFLRVPALSAAVYRLPVGSKDMQAPHLEDEIYVVIEGRARLRISGKDHEVGNESTEDCEGRQVGEVREGAHRRCECQTQETHAQGE